MGSITVRHHDRGFAETSGEPTVAMMLARERFWPGTMHAGVKSDHDMVVLVPAGVGHYSIKSAGRGSGWATRP